MLASASEHFSVSSATSCWIGSSLRPFASFVAINPCSFVSFVVSTVSQANEYKDSLGCAEDPSRDYIGACETNKSFASLPEWNHEHWPRSYASPRTPFGGQGAYPVLTQSSSNGHMQNQHFSGTSPPGGVLIMSPRSTGAFRSGLTLRDRYRDS